MFKGRKPSDKDKEVFLEFLDHVNLEFKKDEEVEKEYKYLCKVMGDLHIEELETLRLAEIIFHSAGLLPNPRNLEELNQNIIDVIAAKGTIINDTNIKSGLILYICITAVMRTAKIDINSGSCEHSELRMVSLSVVQR